MKLTVKKALYEMIEITGKKSSLKFVNSTLKIKKKTKPKTNSNHKKTTNKNSENQTQNDGGVISNDNEEKR